jgi:hypothetical protein
MDKVGFVIVSPALHNLVDANARVFATTVLTSQVKLGRPQTLPGICLAISAGRL